MNLYLEDFEAGVQEILKQANNLFDMGSVAMFPRIENQTSWKYGRADKHLRLSDGTQVYNFQLPNGESHEEDFPLERTEDSPIHSFSEGIESQGTAQIHRADPGSIYFTLHDGSANPTYMLKHQKGTSWKAIPKRKEKSAASIDPQEFLAGALEIIKKAGLGEMVHRGADYMLQKGPNQLMDLMMSPSKIPEVNTPDIINKWTGSLSHLMGGKKPSPENFIGPLTEDNHKYLNMDYSGMDHFPSPLVAAGIGLGAGAIYDQGKRLFYNSPEENEQETKAQRAMRYILPAAGLATANSVQKGLWPQYSQLSPTFNASR